MKPQYDTMSVFWSTWFHGSEIDRLKQIRTLADFMDAYYKIEDEELRKHGITSLMNSYLSDLSEVLLNDLIDEEKLKENGWKQ